MPAIALARPFLPRSPGPSQENNGYFPVKIEAVPEVSCLVLGVLHLPMPRTRFRVTRFRMGQHLNYSLLSLKQ